jgi:hypothetical protein
MLPFKIQINSSEGRQSSTIGELESRMGRHELLLSILVRHFQGGFEIVGGHGRF